MTTVFKGLPLKFDRRQFYVFAIAEHRHGKLTVGTALQDGLNIHHRKDTFAVNGEQLIPDTQTALITRGGFGQVNGKHWYRLDMDGIAVQEEESGYYHKYTFESSKWRYYDTYEMTATEEFDRVFNGRYWWKNYLDELTFDAYDKLTYVGIGQVAEQDCHTFTFDGTVTDGSQAELTLYVRVTDRNVMRMEVQIKSSPNSSHLSTDAWQATIEISSIKTGQDAKGPTLPKPKWEPPENSLGI